MKELVELIERYRPGFAEAIQPASDTDIELLEESAGELPGAYLRFLRTMGADMANFRPLRADFNLEDRLMNYRFDGHYTADAPLLIIASGSGLEPGGSVCLNRLENFQDDDCTVVVLPEEKPPQPSEAQALHAGLEEMLYVEAYSQFRLPLLHGPVQLAARSDEEPDESTVRQVLDTLERIGFRRVPPCQRCALFERDDAAGVLYRHPESNQFSLRLGAQEGPEVLRIADILMHECAVRRLS